MGHTLWVGFTDRPSEQHRATGADLEGRTEWRAFDGARGSGRLDGLRVNWMLLIDGGSTRLRLVASPMVTSLRPADARQVQLSD